jgi:hypothetical protein
MKNRKINLDRPQLDASEISANKSFDQVLSNYQIMVKPFYKQNWFIGTAGLASLSLIIGGSLALQGSDNAESLSRLSISTEAPPNNSRIIHLTNEFDKKQESYPIKEIPETKEVLIQKETAIEEKITPDNTIKTKEVTTVETPIPTTPKKEVETEKNKLKEEKPTVRSGWLSISPKISNKMGGAISKAELFDENGITTDGNVAIVHFELHVIDGAGGKVIEEDGNMLNQEMVNAINNLSEGETIYFENIKGQSEAGTPLRLNPLKYTLK